MSEAVSARGAGPSATNPIGRPPSGGRWFQSGQSAAAVREGAGPGPGLGQRAGASAPRGRVRECVRRRGVGAGGKQDGGGVSGAEGGGGPGRTRVRPGAGSVGGGARQHRGRLAWAGPSQRPACSTRAAAAAGVAPPGLRWHREPPARGLWPAPLRPSKAPRAPRAPRAAADGVRDGKRAPAAVWGGGRPTGPRGRSGIPGRFGGSSETGFDGSCSLRREGPGRPPYRATRARGRRQHTEPEAPAAPRDAQLVVPARAPRGRPAAVGLRARSAVGRAWTARRRPGPAASLSARASEVPGG